MFKYQFTGEIVPKTQPFPLSHTANIVIKNGVFDFVIDINIENFQVSSIIQSESEIRDHLTLRNTVRDILFSLTNVSDYVYCCYHDVLILKYVNLQTNEVIDLDTRMDIFLNDNREGGSQLDSEKIMQLYGRGVKYEYLRVALLDLTLSIKYPKDSGFFCFRAIESLRKFFDNIDISKGWELLKTNLNISREFIDVVQQYAKEVRHGGSILITSEERDKVIKNAWKIVDRFIIYALNNEKPLDNLTFNQL